MTRINVAIPPRNLTDQHLLAEHREIKRMCSLYVNWKSKQTKIPDKFSLGKGHVKFFLNKGKFTHERYKQIYTECKKRRFNVTDYSLNWKSYSPEHYKDYIPPDVDKSILIDRISCRITESKQIPIYYGEKIQKSEAISMLYR